MGLSMMGCEEATHGGDGRTVRFGMSTMTQHRVRLREDGLGIILWTQEEKGVVLVGPYNERPPAKRRISGSSEKVGTGKGDSLGQKINRLF